MFNKCNLMPQNYRHPVVIFHHNGKEYTRFTIHYFTIHQNKNLLNLLVYCIFRIVTNYLQIL